LKTPLEHRKSKRFAHKATVMLEGSDVTQWKKFYYPIDLLKYCFILAGGFSDVRASFLLFCSAFFRLAIPQKVTTAFWKLHRSQGWFKLNRPFLFSAARIWKRFHKILTPV
jgi:hypothetical protein